VIRIASDLLLNEEKLEEAKRNTLLRIKRAAQDMEKLVEAFLLLARESGQGLPLEAIAVSDVLVAEVEKNRAMIDDKPIDLQLDVEQKIEVMAPRQVLAILFSNLIRNAMSYTDKGYVRVRTTNTRVIIEDTGIGMEGLESGELFKPFVRGDHKRRGGHGVGLTIVQKLSDRFGWPVKITSELDVGTRFEIDLAASIDVSLVKRDAS
jgi:signal transduction histidine kinase